VRKRDETISEGGASRDQNNNKIVQRSSITYYMKRIVLVFAKEPFPGSVKTRLSPLLSPAEAAELSTAFLADLLERLRQIGGSDIWIAIPPDSSAQRMALRHGSGVRWVSQGPGDLGERMNRVAQVAFDEGAPGIVLLGSDHPNLPSPFLERCFDALERKRAAWIPTEDGGYAALALPHPAPELFHDIPWSTSAVASKTRLNAQRAGIELEDAGVWYDVDRPQDLFRLMRDLREGPGCPRTSALLAEWKLELRKEGIFRSESESDRRTP
jgi:rSAM/selenodomain-associated transferase 1